MAMARQTREQTVANDRGDGSREMPFSDLTNAVDPNERQGTVATVTADIAVPYGTKNDLPEDMRSQLVELLNRRLADSVDLSTQVKVAHWNVKGPDFIALHELFDEIHESMIEYSDLIAERAVQLGGIAEGTARVAAERSEMDEYPMSVLPGTAHVDALSSALSAFASRTRRGIDEADDLGDQATADIFTEITRGLDKWVWFVEAHRQDP
jgi:starvation-inducible DNA-binding protein